MQDDSEIIQRIQDGETELYEVLVRRHQARLFYWVLNMVGDSDEAEDICQQTFVQVYIHLGRLRSPAAFRVFLFRTAQNQARNLFRRRKKAVPGDPPDVSGPSNVAEEIATEEIQSQLREAIELLPEKQRTAVTLRVIEGFRFSEIGEIMGGSAESARVNFHHAMVRLREWMGQVKK